MKEQEVKCEITIEKERKKGRKGPKAMIKRIKGWSNKEELTKETEQTGREMGRKGMREGGDEQQSQITLEN